jgi:hypothetical protein
MGLMAAQLLLDDEYSPLCQFCIQEDCIRPNDELLPHDDVRYLNRCILAVARFKQLEPATADELIRVKRKVLVWRHL